MATASVLASSDVINEFYCEPCNAEKLNVEATGYCEQCQEYLCDACCSYHRKSTTSKHHKVLETDTMLGTHIKLPVQDALTDMCPKHKEMVLRYICKKHDELCCSMCLSTTHKSCRKKAYIPDISDGVTRSKEYKDLVTQLPRIVATATNEHVRVNVNDKDNHANLDSAVSDINACRADIVKILDIVVDEAIQDVTRLHKENSDKIMTSRHKCMSVISDLNLKTTTLEKRTKASKNNQLFVDMKLTRHRLPALEKDIQDAADRTFLHFKLDKIDKSHELRSTFSAIFTRYVRKEGAEARTRYLKRVFFKTEGDKQECLIDGIAMVTQYRLVVADSANSNVKLVDVRHNSVVSTLLMSSAPLDVIRTEPATVAVALGKERKIEILTVSDVMTRGHTINVPVSDLSSLCYMKDGNKFIVLDAQKRVVKIVAMSGSVLSTVYRDNDTDPLFTQPRHIALSRSQELLYITDSSANTVTTMTVDGRVISVYRHARLRCPLGVTVGWDGAVYICSGNEVHQLSVMGQKVKILIKGSLIRSFRENRQVSSRAIAYDEDSRVVCLSSSELQIREDESGKCNYIRLYQLE